MAIREWSVEDRPREKMMAQGAEALSVAELLAILVGSGTRKESAVELMQRIFDDCGKSLKRMSQLSVDELCRYSGVGPAKAVTILAACELTRRRLMEHSNRQKVTCAKDIYDYFRPAMQDLGVEESRVLLLNQSHTIIGEHLVSRGGIAMTAVDVRVVMKQAIVAQASAIALVHNHPSGNATPSGQDDELTRRVAAAAKTLDLRLLDHVIVTDGGYYSYSDNGKL